MRFFPAVLFFVVLPACLAWGDSVKLKSGEVVEGKILSDTPEEIVIEVNFSATIVERRTIPRAEVLTVEQLSADEVAYQKIKDVVAPATALGAEPFDEILNTQLRPFVAKFPQSPRVEDVRGMITTLEEQKERIAGGEVKLEGNWLSASEHQAEKYQIDAGTLASQIERAGSAGDWVTVLNGFDTLQRSFPGSLAFVGSVPLAREAADELGKQIGFQLQNAPGIIQQRQQTIDRAPPQERERVRAAMEGQEAKVKAQAEAARKQGQKFYPLARFDQKGLAEMQKSLIQVRQELAKIDLPPLERGAQLVREANRLLADNEIATAQTTLAALETTWPAYEGLPRLKKRIADRAKAIETASQHQAEAIKSAAGAAATPTPAASPSRP